MIFHSENQERNKSFFKKSLAILYYVCLTTRKTNDARSPRTELTNSSVSSAFLKLRTPIQKPTISCYMYFRARTSQPQWKLFLRLATNSQYTIQPLHNSSERNGMQIKEEKLTAVRNNILLRFSFFARRGPATVYFSKGARPLSLTTLRLIIRTVRDGARVKRSR